jgi:putative ABC transport system permease protein
MTIASIIQDLLYALRSFGRARGAAAVAFAAIAIGTGGNTAMFSAINSILLRPLPFAEPDRLAAVWSYDTRRDVGARYMSYPDFGDLRRSSSTVSEFAAWYTRAFAIATRSGPLHINVAVVTPSLLPMLGVPAHLGHTFDGKSNADLQAVVLSYGLWQRGFGSDPQVIGRAIVINGTPHVVIGVMPSGFRFPLQAATVDAWTRLPDGGGLLTFRRARVLSVAGRLRAGVSFAEAQAELSSIAAALSREHAEANAGVDVRIAPLADSVFGRLRSPLLVLFAGVVLVLLIACATVANLLLAHGATRDREISIRAGVGATPRRLVRQLLTESMLLALPGAALGAVLGFAACRFFIALSPVESFRLREVQLDLHVLGFTGLVACATGVLFGLVPALRLARIPAAAALQDRTPGASLGAHGGRVQRLLVVGQVAVTLVLLAGAGLLVAEFRRLAKLDMGVDAGNVLTLRLALPDTYDPPGMRAFYARFQQAAQALPGVRSVSSVAPLPLSGDNVAVDFAIEGQEPGLGAQPNADLRIVQPGYFRTIGVRVLAGRDFDERDSDTAPPAAVVNDALAARYFEGSSPLGRRIQQGGTTLTVVGVVASVRHAGPQSAPRPELYLPHMQRPFGEMVAVVKTAPEPTSMVRTLREAVSGIDPALPIYDVRTLDDRLAASVGQERFNMTLLVAFAGVALFLTILGLHGVMTQFSAQRRHEIAVRLAFGAPPASIRSSVVRQGMILVGIGLALGLAGALALTRFMQSILAGVSATDPVVFGSVAALLAGVGFVACYRPAYLASVTDPMEVLRREH